MHGKNIYFLVTRLPLPIILCLRSITFKHLYPLRIPTKRRLKIIEQSQNNSITSLMSKPKNDNAAKLFQSQFTRILRQSNILIEIYLNSQAQNEYHGMNKQRAWLILISATTFCAELDLRCNALINKINHIKFLIKIQNSHFKKIKEKALTKPNNPVKKNKTQNLLFPSKPLL